MSKKNIITAALVLFLLGLVVVAIGYYGFANADVAIITESAHNATQSLFFFGGAMLVVSIILIVIFLG